LSADHRGQSEGLYRTVYDELENCVDFPTGIGDMKVLHCVYWWIHDMICMLLMLRFIAWNMVCGKVLLGCLVPGSYTLKVWNMFWIRMSCIQEIMVILFNVSIDSGGV
jgi:hypothetical protein